MESQACNTDYTHKYPTSLRRERERETDRQRERERETHRERDRERERERERDESEEREREKRVNGGESIDFISFDLPPLFSPASLNYLL
jgi:hypothetical protein